jgi:hypothetical protein
MHVRGMRRATHAAGRHGNPCALPFARHLDATFHTCCHCVVQNELPSLNCGDGGFGGAPFQHLCVLVGADGAIVDVQDQPAFNCRQQCEAWEQ